MKLGLLKTTRRAVQVSVALAFVFIPLLNSKGINWVYGNLLSFNLAGVPLVDPLAVLQVFIQGWSAPNKLLIGAGIVLALALVLGTVFCSWACPFGLLSELTNSLSRRLFPLRKRRSPTGTEMAAKTIGVVAILVFLAVFAAPPLLNQASMPGWYSRIFQMVFLQGYWSWAIVVIAAILLAELLFVRRIWCRYLCPQSLILSWVQTLNPYRLKIGFNPKQCQCKGTDDPCGDYCSLDLKPRTFNSDLEPLCNNCGDCVAVCKKRGGALHYQAKQRRQADS